jgi:hypothetical protein
MDTESASNPIVITPDEQTGEVTGTIGVRDLFFVNKNRRPKWSVPREYARPDDAQVYQQQLARGGFITPDDIRRFNQDNGMPEGALKRLRNDVEYLLKAEISPLSNATYVDRLYQFDTDAKYYQNSYYRFQWIFILGAFITTVISVVAAMSSQIDPSGVLGGVAWFITAVCGVATAVATALNQSRRPQLRWYVNRRKAEAMRRHYYLFMTRAEPYSGDVAARRAKLAEVITQIENIGSSLNTDEAQKAAVITPEPNPIPVDQRLANDELEFLTYIYRERRLQKQVGWYRTRKREFEYNSDFAMLVSAVLVSTTGIFGGLAGLTNNPILFIIPTALPALAAALAAFHQVYGWDRQRRVYDDTIAQLRGAAVNISQGEGATRKANFLNAIQKSEEVFAAESDQWGQGLIDQELAALNAQPSDEQIWNMIQNSSLPAETKTQIETILKPNGGRASSQSSSPTDDPVIPTQ